MSKIPSVKHLISELDQKFTLDDTNAFTGGESIAKVYEDNLPEGITIETVTTVNDYNKNFVEAYAKTSAPFIIEQAKANPELTALELATEVGGTIFTAAFSRPTGEEPTLNDWASSLQFGIGVPKPTTLDTSLRKKLAKGFLEEDEESSDE